MTIVGLTGNFGSGKTFVASVFRALGAKVIDADRIAHSVIAKRGACYGRVVRAFGEGILDDGRNIDRRRLAGIAFGRRQCLKRLERIVHPEVIRYIKKRIGSAKKNEVIVIDAPLLLEAGLGGMVDHIVVVKASLKTQVGRCIKKFKISEEEVLRRIGSQMPVDRKIKRADLVIDNDGTKAETRKTVRKVWRKVYGDS